MGPDVECLPVTVPVMASMPVPADALLAELVAGWEQLPAAERRHVVAVFRVLQGGVRHEH